jgi:hypothetical protein
MAPMLAMDEKGNMYESDSTRSDGLGFGRDPSNAEQGDVAITSPHLWAEKQRTAQREKMKVYNLDLARKRKVAAKLQQKKKALARRNADIKEKQYESMKYSNMGQDPMLEKAIRQNKMGENFEKIGISGHGLSADGDLRADRALGFGSGVNCSLGENADFGRPDLRSYDGKADFGRSADFAIYDDVPAKAFTDEATVKAKGFGFFPSLSDITSFVSPVVSSAQQALAAVTGQAITGALTPSTAMSPTPAQIAAQNEAKLQAAIASQQLQTQTILAQQQAQSAVESAQMKKYMMYGGIGLASLIGLTVVLKIIKK